VSQGCGLRPSDGDRARTQKR